MLPLPAQLIHNTAVPSLLSLKAGLTGQTDACVVADASALAEFDSSALAVLLALRREVLAAGKTFSVQGLPGRLRVLAGLYGVEGLLPASA